MDTGETILRSWDYAQTKGAIFTKGTYNLTVTDKRVIQTSDTKRGTSTTSVKLSEVGGVSTTLNKGSILAGIVMLILGVVLTIVFAIAFLPMIFFGILLIVLGIIVCVCAKTSITVSLYLSSLPQTFISANNIRFRKRMKVLRVKVDRSVAEEISSQLAALILLK